MIPRMDNVDSKSPSLLDLLDELIHLPLEERERRIAQAQPSDADRAQLDSWLRLQESGGRFLETPPRLVLDSMRLLRNSGARSSSINSGSGGASDSSAVEAEGLRWATPPQVPGYEIGELLGQGGMGTVWRAVQTGTGREVALKVMEPMLLASRRARSRFERELRLTARLQHPHICRVYDGGSTGSVCYNAMELIDGVPLDQYAQGLDAPVPRERRRQVLQLMAHVCQAVGHAHQNAVIHRDLKPSNILIDRQGQPHLVDFGLAKALEEAGADLTVTLDGDLAGTPAYMSPEQAGGERTLDTRTDVYSLGVIMFRLLTGKSPHDLAGSRLEVLRRIAEQDVTRPQLGEAGIDRELQAIVLRALARRPDDRYSSAAELADDLQRYLSGEPVIARSPTFTYVLVKNLRKHRSLIAAACAALAMMTAVAVYSYVRVVQHSRASDRSARAEGEARKAAELNLAAALIAQGDALGASQQWPGAKARYQQARELLQAQGQSPFLAEVALWDANRRSPAPLLEFRAHTGELNYLRFLPDGKQLATAGQDGAARIWETRTGRLIRTFPNLGDVQRLSISSDGSLIAFASMTTGVTIWRIADGTLVRTIGGFAGRASAVCFSPIAPRLLVGTADMPYNLYLFDAESGELLKTFGGHETSIRDIAFTPDGQKVVSCDGRPPGDKLGFNLNVTLRAWDISKGSQLWSRPADLNGRLAGAIAISRDGGTVACTCWDGAAKLYEVATGSGQILTGSESGRDVQGVAFSSDGLLALGGPSGSIRVLRPVEKEAREAFGTSMGNHPMIEMRRLGGHAGETRTLDFSPDGRVIVSGGGDGMVRIWPVNDGGETQVFSDTPYGNIFEIFNAALSSDCQTALSSSNEDKLIRLWHVPSGTVISSIGTADGHDPAAAFGPRDKTIVLIEKDGRIGVWDNLLRQRLGALDPPEHRQFGSIALSPDGRTLLACFTDGGDAVVYDLPGKKLLKQLVLADPLRDRDHLRPVGAGPRGDRRLRFSPDGAFAVGLVQYANLVKIWDTTDWRERTALSVPRPERVAVSADSKWIACVGTDVRVYDSQSGALAHHFNEAADSLAAVAFLADARYLVTEGTPGDGLALWDLVNDTRVRSIGQGSFVFDLTAAANGTLLWAQRSSAGALNLAHLDWARTNDAILRKLGTARDRLQADPNDAGGLAALGQWYAFRGMDDWAADLLEQAAKRAGPRAPRPAWETALLMTCRKRLLAGVAQPNKNPS